jgi:hypothetical protein
MNGESRPNKASDDSESGRRPDCSAHRNRFAAAPLDPTRVDGNSVRIEKTLRL